MISFGAVDHQRPSPDRRRRDDFEPHVHRMEWATSIFGSVERSRNVIMHCGVLDIEDVEGLGIKIRDWISRSARSDLVGGAPKHLLWTGSPFPRKRCWTAIIGDSLCI